MASVRVDNGEPFVAGIPDHDGLVLHPQLCASLACNAQHVRARRLRRVESKGVETGPWFSLEFDEASGEIAPTDDETRGLIAEMPWLADWVRENRGPLENRYVRLRGLRDSPDGRADVAPDWRPGELISYLAKKNAEGRRGTPGRGRWTRGSNDPLSADGDACPCGSGKRWKKCGKPR